jgi:hypothetical protein
MENLQNNNLNSNLENHEIKKNMSDEFLLFLKENGKIAQIGGELNNSLYDLKIQIKNKNFEKIEDDAKNLEAHIFWMTTFTKYIRFKALFIYIDNNSEMSEENKKLMIKFNSPTQEDTNADIEKVQKFIDFYSAPDYRWEDGKVKTTRGSDSASYELMKELLDFLKIEIESVNE